MFHLSSLPVRRDQVSWQRYALTPTAQAQIKGGNGGSTPPDVSTTTSFLITEDVLDL